MFFFHFFSNNEVIFFFLLGLCDLKFAIFFFCFFVGVQQPDTSAILVLLDSR